VRRQSSGGSCMTRFRPKRGPDFIIGPAHDPYMLRWWLIPRNRVFNIYLHHVRHDDDDRALHDHPWWSVSFLIGGRLGEHYLRRSEARYREVRRWVPLLRSAEFAHRLVLPDSDQGAWTIFMTGPKVRVWGFLCPRGWVDWRTFTKPERPGEVGRGCGEEL